jgi:hypothetical protein
MTGFGEPVVAWRGATDPDAPVIVCIVLLTERLRR